MDSTGSIIKTVVDLVRRTLDETDLNAKLTDQVLVEKYLPMAIHEIQGRIAMDTDLPIFMTYDITIENTGVVERFTLPPSIQQIHGLVQEDSNGRVVNEIIPTSTNFHDVRGRTWTIEGNELRVDSRGMSAGTWKVLYVPGPESFPHYADGGTLSDASTMTLDGTPTLGLLDRRPGGYVGATVRILPSGGGPIEERIISGHSYSGGNWVVTFRKPLLHTTSGTATYEVVPTLDTAMVWALTYAVTLQVGAARRLPGATFQMFLQRYNAALKALSDRISNMQGRTGRSFYVYDWGNF